MILFDILCCLFVLYLVVSARAAIDDLHSQEILQKKEIEKEIKELFKK